MTNIKKATGRTPPARVWREARIGGYEVWTVYDHDAKLYELFASEAADDYIGCADTYANACAFAASWIKERRAEAGQ